MLFAAAPATTDTTSWKLLGGSLSVDPLGWAYHPAIASSAGGATYAAWSQHTRPASWQLVGSYAKRWASGNWQSLGGRVGHVPGEDGARWAASYAPSLTVLGSTPYLAWYEGGGYGWGTIDGTPVTSSVFVAHWDGSRWALDRDVQSPNGALNQEDAGRTPRLAVVRGTLYAAWIETRGIPDTYGTYNVIVVKRLSNGRWARVGEELRRGRTPSDARIVDLAVAGVGATLYVVWSEFDLAGGGSGTVQVARLVDGGWSPIGRPLNGLRDGHANHVAIASLNDVPYVAWQERSGAGNNQLFVKFWSAGNWIAAGGSLNVEPTRGEAGAPALATDGARIWLAWAEAAPGQRAALRVRTLTERTWSAPSPPLNVAPGDGAADGPALTAAGARPVLIWAEKKPPPATSQVFVRMLE